MGYTHECDVCGEGFDSLPAFVGEVREAWFKTTALGGILADEGYSPGETITFCGECIVDLLTDQYQGR